MPVRPSKKIRNYGIQPSATPIQGYSRKRSADEYHTSRWTKESKAFRTANPLCVLCEKEGIVKASEVVDHVIPFPVCGDFWNQSNWQALCKKHNVDKGNRDKKIITEFKNKSNGK